MVLPTSRRRSIRRRKRTSDDSNNRVAATVTILCATIAIPYVVHKIANNNGNGNNNNHHNSPAWKPKRRTSAIRNPKDIPSVEDLEAEQRAQQREDRYQSLYKPKFSESTLGYDLHNCPHTPPKDYPMEWKATEVLSNWNPNDVTTTTSNSRNIYQGLCIFDFQTQYATALNYRQLEKPFIIRNDPKITSVSRRWEDDPEYLHRTFGDVEQFRTERSPTNQFMWYRLRSHKRAPKGYEQPPNDEIEMTFGEWLEHAIEKDGKALDDATMIKRANALRERRLGLTHLHQNGDVEEDDPPVDVDDTEGQQDQDSEEAKRKKYYYFRINADMKKAGKASISKFIYDELPFFDPRQRKDSQFYIVDPREERGINCRFGMRGVTAANHFDMSRNTIAVLGGERRYILAKPSNCKNMALYPQSHPSVRHSSLDWSNPNEWDEHPEFKNAYVNEVVLHAGDVLYLPTNYFHYIVNLSLNYQCNARSGTTYETGHFIEDCGFKIP